MERERAIPILDAIDINILQHNFPIETTKLAKEINIGRKNLWEHLNRLETLGMIVRNKQGHIIWIDLNPNKFVAESIGNFIKMLTIGMGCSLSPNVLRAKLTKKKK